MHEKKFGCGRDDGNGGAGSGLKLENCGGIGPCMDGGRAGCIVGCDGNAGGIVGILAEVKLENVGGGGGGGGGGIAVGECIDGREYMVR